MTFFDYYLIGAIASSVVLNVMTFANVDVRRIAKENGYITSIFIALVVCGIIWPVMIGTMLTPKKMTARLATRLKEMAEEEEKEEDDV